MTIQVMLANVHSKKMITVKGKYRRESCQKAERKRRFEKPEIKRNLSKVKR